MDLLSESVFFILKELKPDIPQVKIVVLIANRLGCSSKIAGPKGGYLYYVLSKIRFVYK